MSDDAFFKVRELQCLRLCLPTYRYGKGSDSVGAHYFEIDMLRPLSSHQSKRLLEAISECVMTALTIPNDEGEYTFVIRMKKVQEGLSDCRHCEGTRELHVFNHKGGSYREPCEFCFEGKPS